MSRLRLASLAGAALGSVAVAGAAVGVRPRLVYNPTPSAPIGFYRVVAPADLQLGMLVTVAVPDAFRPLVTQRGYIGPNVPLLKRVVALSGDLVCERQGSVAINGVVRAEALVADGQGRPMPIWEGCRRLAPGELFALGDRSRYSLDSRYFGPLPTSLVRGIARPLWTW